MCNHEDRYWTLASLVLSKEATEADLAELMDLTANTGQAELLRSLSVLWNTDNQNDQAAFDRFFERLTKRLQDENVRHL